MYLKLTDFEEHSCIDDDKNEETKPLVELIKMKVSLNVIQGVIQAKRV